METITYTNTRGQSISFTYGGDYMIESYSGFGGAAIEPTQVKGYGQNGYAFGGSLYGLRTVTLNVLIKSVDMAETYQRRNEMATVFNPLLGQGLLRYTNDYLSHCLRCYCSVLPEPTTKYGNLVKYTVTLVATQPFWFDEPENGAQLIGATGGLTFDFKFDNTIQFGTTSSAGAIINDGDIAAPMRIVLRNADIVNPRITLSGTDQYIQINKNINHNEKVEITTDYGNKMVRIDGVSAMRYLDEGSTFFDLPVGENRLAVTTASGEPEVFIYWRNYYAGV